MILSDTLWAVIKLLAGFAMLFFGGDWLVSGGVALARRFRISPLVIGMTIVAFGTSAPELLVSLTSAIKGVSGIAMGNVLGSNIANIGLILGLTAIICPIVTDNRKVLINGTIMILASLLVTLFSHNSGISGTEGAILLLCIMAFTVISVMKGRAKGQESNIQSEDSKITLKLFPAIALIILSCAMLAYGADILVDGATTLARNVGISEKVIGLTVVALGTSLPELAASVAAAIKKQMDISIGNIIGSNIFNLLCVLGASAAIKPISFEFDNYLYDFVFVLIFSVALLLFTTFGRQKGRLGRVAGIILLTSYIIYITLLF